MARIRNKRSNDSRSRFVGLIHECNIGNYPYAEIMPIGDLHLGDPTLNKPLLRAVIKWVNAQPYRKIVIVGDVFNAGIRDSVSDVYSENMTLDEAIKAFRELVEVMGSDNILACIRGNHDNRVVKAVGIDPVAVACELAGVKYFGAEAYLCFTVGQWHKSRQNPIKYLCYMTHGVGGGRMMGGKINALMRNNQTIIADIILQGHTHTPAIVPNMIYEADSRYNSIHERDQLFITTCGFIGRDGYAKDYGFPPVSQKFPIVKLGGRSKRLSALLIDPLDCEE